MRAENKWYGGILATAMLLAMGTQALAAESDRNELQEIVVTAQKRTENAQLVPASITVLRGSDLERIHATSLADYVGYIPGLSLGSQGSPGLNTLTLDGIPPLGSASEIGVYVGDIPIGSSSGFEAADTLTLDLMPYDLDRIEVLRGPQGTLYGASTMGGLIKYVLANPSLERFSGRVGVGAFDVHGAGEAGFGFRGMVNLPMLDGRFALRASGYEQWTPGYINSGVSGARHQNGTRQTGGRLAALWQPASDFSLELSVLEQKVAAEGLGDEALDYATGTQTLYGDLTDDNALPQPFRQEIQVYGATLKYDLHWAQLTSVSSYQRFSNDLIQDLSSTYGPYLPGFGAPGPGLVDLAEQLNIKKFTQEVRLASPQGRTFEWLLGGFYTHEDGTNNQGYDSFDLTGAPLPGFDLAAVQIPNTYREWAAFGDLTWHLTPKFDMTGGLRYAHNEQSFQEVTGGLLFGGAATTTPLFTSSEGVVTFLASPRYRINSNSIVYVRVASGYQPGSPNAAVPGYVIPTQVNSSRLIDYQPGLKLTFLGNRLTADASAFYIQWKDIQVQVATPDGAATYLANAASARSQGFDLSMSYLPLTGLILGANVAYTDAFLTADVPVLGTVSGARLPQVPKWSGSATANYDFPLGSRWRGFVGGGYRQVGDEWSLAEGETGGLMTRSYHALDLHAGIDNDRWTLSVYGKNLNDARALQAPLIQESDATLLPIDSKAAVVQPRTIGIDVDVSF